ncbi:MAG: substrate-binding domain-containing protein [Spirochaetota bacterium]
MAPRTNGGPGKIAVITAELSDSYQAALWRGIADEAERRDRTLVCFLGSRVDSPIESEAAANEIYGLAGADNFDGLIVISSAISTYSDQERIQALFDSFAGMPRVSVGVRVEGASTVLVDGRHAVLETIGHLIERHDRTRIALVAGPRWHPESEQRRGAFLEALSAHGLKFDDRLLAHGTFEADSGRVAVRELLERAVPFDSLVCLNDRMALGALSELRAHGYEVPRDVSLVGFDGIEDTLYSTPPLTTISQPLHELGIRAVREIYDLLDGRSPMDVVLQCKPLIRESCGCPVTMRFPVESRVDPDSESLGVNSVAPEQLRALLAGGDREGFLDRFNAALTETLLRGGPLNPWTDVLVSLRSSLSHDRGEERVLDEAAVLLGEIKARFQARRRIVHTENARLLRAVGISLTEAFEADELVRRLKTGLARLGVTEAFLVVYGDDRRGRDESTLLLSGSPRLDRGETATDERFPRSQVLPDGVLEASEGKTWLLFPLVFEDHAFGYLLLPGGYPDAGMYEALGKQVASSLQGALLMDTVREHEHSLEREVARRTDALTRANRSLRVEVEKRTRLEREVAEISRQTMERIGQDLHDDLCQYLAGVSMEIGTLEAMVAAGDADAVAKAAHIHRLIGDSIERAKAIVRGLVPARLREDGLLAAVRTIADAVRQSSGLTIHISDSEESRDAAARIEPERALELYRIVQEALNNSVRHSGCSRVEIRFVSRRRDDGQVGLSIVVSDDGKGIDRETNGTGMGLRIMRYRAQAADASLSIEPDATGTTVRCDLVVPSEGVRDWNAS